MLLRPNVTRQKKLDENELDKNELRRKCTRRNVTEPYNESLGLYVLHEGFK